MNKKRDTTGKRELSGGVSFFMLLCVLALLCDTRGSVLAPLLPEGATAWQPPAAKEGQGDCDFPLGPPWILLYPLKRRRSARGMEAAERRVLTRRSAAGARDRVVGAALHSYVAALNCGLMWQCLAVLSPERAREGPQALSCFIRTRRRVRRVRGNFFVGELSPRRRNCFLAVSAPGNAQHFSGNW